MKVLATEIKAGSEIRVSGFIKGYSEIVQLYPRISKDVNGCRVNGNKADGYISTGSITKKSPILLVSNIEHGSEEGFANGGAGRFTFVPTLILTTNEGRFTINIRQKVEMLK